MRLGFAALAGLVPVAFAAVGCPSLSGLTGGDDDAGDAGDVSDTSPVDSGLGMRCGNQRCTIGQQNCCYNGGDASAASFSCEAPDSAAGCVFRITCAASADCVAMGAPDDVCCATRFGEGGIIVQSIQCESRVTCLGSATQSVVLCDPAAPSCSNGQMCASLAKSDVIYACQ